jgi:hypothetical protein
MCGTETEGEDLPEFEHNISGEVGWKRGRLIDFLTQQNIALVFNERIAPALGVGYGGNIALFPGQSKPEEFVTLEVRIYKSCFSLCPNTFASSRGPFSSVWCMKKSGAGGDRLSIEPSGHRPYKRPWHCRAI